MKNTIFINFLIIILLLIVSCDDNSKNQLLEDEINPSIAVENSSEIITKVTPKSENLNEDFKQKKDLDNEDQIDLSMDDTVMKSNDIILKEKDDLDLKESKNPIIFKVVSGSKLIYSIREKLLRIPAPFDAELVSQSVSGEIRLDGNSFQIDVDLHKLVSDEPKRDKYVRERLFPDQPISTAKFSGLDEISEEFFLGNELERVVTGIVNVNGVDSNIDFDLLAVFDSDSETLKITGQASFKWSDFGMKTPTSNFFTLSDEINLEIFIISEAIRIESNLISESKNKQIIPDYLLNPWLCIDGENYVSDLTSGNTLECKVELDVSNETLHVITTGIPSHDFESTLGCCASEQSQIWRIPITPVYIDKTTLAPERGPIAFAVNGAAIYGPEEGPGGDAVALHFDKFEEDRQPIELGICGGHSGPGGQYHYHYDANCFHWHPDTNQTDNDYSMQNIIDKSDTSEIIGFAFDGFPIYGVLGSDSNGDIKEMKSSYKLKSGANGYGGIEDYYYVEGLGDLDECNGHYHKTQDVPEGIYHYHSTIHNGEDDLGFPYFIYCYHGEVNESNFSLGNIFERPPGGGPPLGGGPPPGGPPDPEILRELLLEAEIIVPEGTSDEEIISIYGPMLKRKP